MGRDPPPGQKNNLRSISIHSPAWGATFDDETRRVQRLISIHAPAWGATCYDAFYRRLVSLSIHAPAWGATRSAFLGSCSITYFNPRARVGRDLVFGDGADVQRDFNPRARVGRDHSDRTDPRPPKISIHAPAWGATRGCCMEISFKTFQSTRPRGARRAALHVHGRPRIISIHAPAWGATIVTPSFVAFSIFQSTRPRGARQTGAAPLLRRCRFQSTRPRGARRFTHEARELHEAFQSTRPRGARQGGGRQPWRRQ